MPSDAPGPDPGSPAALSRRSVLAGGSRGLLALALIGPAAAACGPSGPPEPDPLEAELSAARADSELAAAAAKAAPPEIAPALIEVSAERTRHANALVEELSRAAGKPTPTPWAETTSASVTAQSTPPAPPPTLKDVVAALRRSGENAAKLAPQLSGYRAGLLGSIAAACTTAWMVGLQPVGGPR
ncbi:hypothetical protein [Mycolicibacterium sp.]|uniref:hypothetical protein n=1 Tax=Mycolicibacterium sp. TaxID=2320850 RepID=UPI001A20B4C2|nr:hypothetical protein [Mycolicibacterium sp.]MBJ7399300.1 hypothetical protein [Mycolicibacterium sp.]